MTTPGKDKTIIRLLTDEKTQRQAFSLIVEKYSQPLYYRIRSIVNNHDDADDVLQNTLLKAWRNIGTFRGEALLSTWLYRIAVNEALDFLRRNKNAADVSADQVSLASHLETDAYFDGNHAQALLQEAIATLPDVQRAVFTLRYYHETKYSQMSKMMNTSEGALKASYHIAVKKITAYLKQHD